MIPDPWTFALLSLAAWRTWKLIGDDRIMERPRDWFLKRMGGPRTVRFTYWSEFLGCPYCLGFWAALGWWGAWYLWPHGVTVAAVPMAVSAAVGLAGTLYYLMDGE